jgi:hypothetical protein
MYQSSFGTENQVQFDNEHEYYELLGFLAKSDGTTSLTWERNEEQGAWGSEGRIKFYTSILPFLATLSHTAGVGNVVSRVNCNEFVQNLYEDHDFVNGGTQEVSAIRATIPEEYLADFERGLNL